MVNSLRFAYNQTTVDRFNDDYFDPRDLGASVYNYSPTHEMVVVVTGGFNIAASTATRGIADNKTWQISEDLTLVRGRHQIALGVERGLLGHAAEGMGQRRRQLEVQRQHHRARHGRLPARPGRDLRARLVLRRPPQSVVPGLVCAGYLARDRTGDAQCGPPLGAVPRASRSPTARSRISASTTSASGIKSTRVHERAGRASSIRATTGFPADDRASRSSGELVAARRRRLGRDSATAACRVRSSYGSELRLSDRGILVPPGRRAAVSATCCG